MSLSQEINYTDEVGQVIKVKLGVLSPKRILEASVCEVYNHITSPDGSQNGTLFDPRMGASSRNKANASSDTVATDTTFAPCLICMFQRFFPTTQARKVLQKSIIQSVLERRSKRS